MSIEKRGNSWRVRVVRNGKKMNRSFGTKREAEAFLNYWKKEGFSGALSSAQMAEATLAFERLGGQSLLEAADFYLLHGAACAAAPTVAVGVKQYLEELRMLKRSEAHRKSMKNWLKRFVARFGEVKPIQVTTPEVKTWILELGRESGLSSTTKLAAVRAARIWLGWALKQEWIKEMPVLDDAGIPRDDVEEPEFYSAAQTRDFFKLLEEKYPQAIPHFAVRAFFGLRTAEANRLTWDDVDLDAKILRVRATKTKTKVARTLDTDLVPETGFVWLRAYFDRGRASFRVDPKLGTRIYADFGSAVDNGFRKSFATMFTSLTKNQQMTMMATGHTSLTTLRRHYEATKQPKEEAQAYFAVLPTKRKR